VAVRLPGDRRKAGDLPEGVRHFQLFPALGVKSDLLLHGAGGAGNDIGDLPLEIRRSAIFDPQFFLPNSSEGKLPTYAFFPHVIAEGFSTTEWSNSLQSRCAESCLQFQQECDFKYLIIPSRFYEGMPSDFIDNQDRSFVRPFIESARRLRPTKPLLLQLILTDQMIKDERYRTELLNWITSYSEIQGVYLIYHVHNRHKQIEDVDFLVSLLGFCTALKLVDMTVVVGYCNTEALLLTCTGCDVVTIGSYENLRMFNTTAFEDNEEKKIRGPNARVYIPKLLQWVEHPYIGAIKRVVRNIDQYIEDNSHRVAMFSPTYNWHFTKPDPYKHYFITFTRQLQRLCSNSGDARVGALLAECRQAITEFERLQRGGIVFDQDSSGAHLSKWITAINLWRRNH